MPVKSSQGFEPVRLDIRSDSSGDLGACGSPDGEGAVRARVKANRTPNIPAAVSSERAAAGTDLCLC